MKRINIIFNSRRLLLLLNLLHTAVCDGGGGTQGNTQPVRIVLGGFVFFVAFIIGVHCCLKRRERMKFDEGKSCSPVFKEIKDRRESQVPKERRESKVAFHKVEMDKNFI